MGNTQATEWRKAAWEDRANLVDKVKEFQPANKNIQYVRIMLHGPVGAGKSSFINSVSSCLRGRMVNEAHVDSSTGPSYTKQYQTHKTHKKGEPDNLYRFVFTDIMGLEDSSGIHEDDIKLALEGHIKDGYTFDPFKTIKEKDPLYNHGPAPEDKVHVLVSVIPGPNVKMLSQELIEKIKRIRDAASELGVPQICIITKIDQVSDELKKDIKNVYKMKVVKDTMETFSARSGIPMTEIFPVKNYHQETALNPDVDVLILEALQHMIHMGEDFVNKM